MADTKNLIDFMNDGAMRTAAELGEAGFSREMLRRAVHDEHLCEITRGVYRANHQVHYHELEDVATAWFLNRGSIVSFDTAANYHGLSDAVVNSVHLTFPYGGRPSARTSGAGVHVVGHWTRVDAGMEVGVEAVEIAGVKVHMTNVHRTFLDIISNSITKDSELASKVLVTYAQDHHDGKILGAYADALGISSTLFERRIYDTQQAFSVGANSGPGF